MRTATASIHIPLTDENAQPFDNVTVEVEAVVYYKVVDPVKSPFEVQDFGPGPMPEAEAVRPVSNAAETYFKERAELMRRLEALNSTLAQNTKYIVPSNAG